jgi:hypothetical protein
VAQTGQYVPYLRVGASINNRRFEGPHAYGPPPRGRISNTGRERWRSRSSRPTATTRSPSCGCLRGAHPSSTAPRDSPSTVGNRRRQRRRSRPYGGPTTARTLPGLAGSGEGRTGPFPGLSAVAPGAPTGYLSADLATSIDVVLAETYLPVEVTHGVRYVEPAGRQRGRPCTAPVTGSLSRLLCRPCSLQSSPSPPLRCPRSPPRPGDDPGSSAVAGPHATFRVTRQQVLSRRHRDRELSPLPHLHPIRAPAERPENVHARSSRTAGGGIGRRRPAPHLPDADYSPAGRRR